MNVTRVLLKSDLRRVYDLWNLHLRLRPGEAIIAINRAETMFRMVDWNGVLYTGYADAGEVFDLVAIAALFRNSGLNIEPAQLRRVA